MQFFVNKQTIYIIILMLEMKYFYFSWDTNEKNGLFMLIQYTYFFL